MPSSSSTVLERTERDDVVVAEQPVRSMDLADPIEGIFPLSLAEKLVDDEMHKLMVERFRKPQPGSWTVEFLLKKAIQDLGIPHLVHIPQKRQGWGECEVIE